MEQTLSFLNPVIASDPDFDELFRAVDAGALPALASGLSEIHKALVLSALSAKTGTPMCVVVPDESAALSLTGLLEALGVKALYYPSREPEIGAVLAGSKEYEQQRIRTLSALADGDFGVAVMSMEAFCFPTPPLRSVAARRFSLEPGQSISVKELTGRLVSAGYTRMETVEGIGQFSLRGGILDVFVPESDQPARIEFWGDEIDTISSFDIETQRREDSLSCLRIIPAREVGGSESLLAEKLREYLDTHPRLSEKHRRQVEADWQALREGREVPGDRYAVLLQKPRFFADEFEGLTVLCETATLEERLLSIHRQWQEDLGLFTENGYLCENTESLLLSAAEFAEKTRWSVILEQFPRGRYENPPKSMVSFHVKRNSPWNGDLSVLCEDLSFLCEHHGRSVVLAGGEKAGRLLCEDLRDRGISACYRENPEVLSDGVTVTVGGLPCGFELENIRFSLISYRNVSAMPKKQRPRIKDAKSVGSLSELTVGDAVVHAGHGIGIFAGIQSLENAGVKRDYIKIRYAGQDVLYVPVTQLDLVSRYIGADSREVKINRLSGGEWQKTRKRVRKAVRDMAKQLTALYAKRMAMPGYAFSPDSDLQNDFERRFPYEETQDQLRCVREIKEDMERPVPMDRLLCGDVGFGKTEVALRAAFKCISEGKQCAVLVPTTILALQHYQTIKNRIGDLPVEVRMLSRFVGEKQRERTVRDLAVGAVDLVVGTHRLISSDISFRDLGLLIVDEEQRFGVAQKEKLKEKYPRVDVLTLSATPIPRTLNMAMSGLRDMSSIDEAPSDRHPVQTYVMEQNNGVLYDAMRKELRRGGQVYYLHNRVEDITRTAARIAAALPEARIRVAHGKMSEEELSVIWKDLLEQQIDILVCTTIIETGVDVANANTLIIEDADHFGLAQLHQLRGRVGRSSRRAYAYFCFRGGKALSEEASKRLEAIRQFTEFGSGFQIAMRDLEIRGAGSVLGGAQHGNMEAVGYDLYLKLLSDALKEEKEGKTDHPLLSEEEPEQRECTVDLNIPSHIPESYIASLPARLGIYKRIAAIGNEEDAADVIDELCDRFGEPPKTVMGLIDIALLRNRSMQYGIYEIVREKDDVILHMNEFSKDLFLKLGGVFGERLRVPAGEKPALAIRMKKGQKLTDLVGEIASNL